MPQTPRPSSHLPQTAAHASCCHCHHGLVSSLQALLRSLREALCAQLQALLRPHPSCRTLPQFSAARTPPIGASAAFKPLQLHPPRLGVDYHPLPAATVGRPFLSHPPPRSLSPPLLSFFRETHCTLREAVFPIRSLLVLISTHSIPLNLNALHTHSFCPPVDLFEKPNPSPPSQPTLNKRPRLAPRQPASYRKSLTDRNLSQQRCPSWS